MKSATVVPLTRTEEFDVIARKCPGCRDLKDQVGVLFVDSWPNGQVREVTFQPEYSRLQNAIVDVGDYHHDVDCIELTDRETGKQWRFEIDDLGGWFEDEDEDEDEE